MHRTKPNDSFGGSRFAMLDRANRVERATIDAHPFPAGVQLCGT
jgi:hypothetical protein